MKKALNIIIIAVIILFCKSIPSFAAISLSYSFDYNGGYIVDYDSDHTRSTRLGFALGIEATQQMETLELGAGVEWQKPRKMSYELEDDCEVGFTTAYGVARLYLREIGSVNYNTYILGRIGYGVSESNHLQQTASGLYYALGIGAKGDFGVFSGIELYFSDNQGLIEAETAPQTIEYKKVSILIGIEI